MFYLHDQSPFSMWKKMRFFNNVSMSVARVLSKELSYIYIFYTKTTDSTNTEINQI